MLSSPLTQGTGSRYGSARSLWAGEQGTQQEPGRGPPRGEAADTVPSLLIGTVQPAQMHWSASASPFSPSLQVASGSGAAHGRWCGGWSWQSRGCCRVPTLHWHERVSGTQHWNEPWYSRLTSHSQSTARRGFSFPRPSQSCRQPPARAWLAVRSQHEPSSPLSLAHHPQGTPQSLEDESAARFAHLVAAVHHLAHEGAAHGRATVQGQVPAGGCGEGPGWGQGGLG